MNNPDYGLNERNNRLLGVLEAALKVFTDGAKLNAIQLTPDAAKEIMEICQDGVDKMEGASKGITPFQRAVTGAQYTLNAIREWREKGALHDPEQN